MVCGVFRPEAQRASELAVVGFLGDACKNEIISRRRVFVTTIRVETTSLLILFLNNKKHKYRRVSTFSCCFCSGCKLNDATRLFLMFLDSLTAAVESVTAAEWSTPLTSYRSRNAKAFLFSIRSFLIRCAFLQLRNVCFISSIKLHCTKEGSVDRQETLLKSACFAASFYATKTFGIEFSRRCLFGP